MGMEIMTMTNGVSKRTWDLMEWESALQKIQSVVLGVMLGVLHLALPNVGKWGWITHARSALSGRERITGVGHQVFITGNS